MFVCVEVGDFRYVWWFVMFVCMVVGDVGMYGDVGMCGGW